MASVAMEPMAADSVGVAQPAIIEPTTEPKIAVSGQCLGLAEKPSGRLIASDLFAENDTILCDLFLLTLTVKTKILSDPVESKSRQRPQDQIYQYL